MFIKAITKTVKNTDKRYSYYRLCESYRIGNKVRHRAIVNLGDLSELTAKEDRKLLADRIEEIIRGEGPLFEIQNKRVEELAHRYAGIIINQKLIDIPLKRAEERAKGITDYQSIDINSVTHNEVREIGGEWLCKQAIEQLGLEGYLEALGWKRKWIIRGMIYLIARAVYPASDRKTADWLQRNSGICELYNIEAKKVTRHHLYKVSKMLYRQKEEIERYLREKTGELFTKEDKIMIYDLTNTYFEGDKEGSEKARYGRSKEKRSDAKLLSIAMVVDRYGFVKHSKIYEGNIKESKTLKETIRDIGGNRSDKDRKEVIVMDAGIATEGNLEMLRGEGYEYVCVSLCKPYKVEGIGGEVGEGVGFEDRDGNRIRARWIEVEGKGDSFLYVRSEKKVKKEGAIEELQCKRYEEGLQGIREGIEKKGGIKRIEKVYERIGRLKERYPSVNRYYEVEVKGEGGVAKEISWRKVLDGRGRQGVYFIRTTFKEKDEKTVWDIYNTIREIEASFRTLKTDLKVRPIHHQRDYSSEAHIYGSILAYTIVNSIRAQLKGKGIHYDWSNIVRIMNSQKIVTTSMKAKTGSVIYVKKCSEPEREVAQIYHALNYSDRPFWQKKSVLPESGKPKKEVIDTG